MTCQSELELIANLYALHDKTVLTLDKRIVEQDEKINSQDEEITSLKKELDRLKELLKLQKHRLFGQRSEKDKGEKCSQGSEQGEISVSAHQRKKKTKGRLLSTEHLPHFQKIYDLSEEEKTCEHCQCALHKIKEHATEQLELIPLRYCVVEHIQIVYGCRTCSRVVTPTKPIAPIPKSIAGASVLTDIILNKYQSHQPLYRQSKRLKQDGLLIPDNTLANWTVKIGFGLDCLYEAMWCILKLRYLQVDETPVKLLEPNKKGYLWTYYAPHIGDKHGLVVFELSETRSAEVAKKRLKSFCGLLQTDGYAGYHALRKRKGIVGLGCFTHARRRFTEVVKITGDKKGLAAEMLKRMKPLYELEKRMKTKKLSFHTRKRLRQRIARPIIKAIHKWLRSVQPSVPPKSKLGQATQYTLNQWRYLIAYLRHGQAEIDTNDVENKIREIALGKKNWLFIGNKDTGKIHAIFYSLIISCILNELNPRLYMHYVISKIHDLRKGNIKPIDILPHTIDKSILSAFADEQIVFAKSIFDSS